MVKRIINVEGDEIVIRVKISAFPYAAKIAWDNWYGNEHNISVTDVDVFAKDLILELLKESEDGSNMIDLMLDKACVNVAEWSLGVSID